MTADTAISPENGVLLAFRRDLRLAIRSKGEVIQAMVFFCHRGEFISAGRRCGIGIIEAHCTRCGVGRRAVVGAAHVAAHIC